MIRHMAIDPAVLRKKIRRGHIHFGGNIRLKIYGRLNCRSGKKMRKESRVFFTASREAWKAGYRPCGHCMAAEYRKWKISRKKKEEGSTVF